MDHNTSAGFGGAVAATVAAYATGAVNGAIGAIRVVGHNVIAMVSAASLTSPGILSLKKKRCWAGSE